jgi:hypothetical protein
MRMEVTRMIIMLTLKMKITTMMSEDGNDDNKENEDDEV